MNAKLLLKVIAMTSYFALLLCSAYWLFVHIVIGIDRSVVVCQRQMELFPIFVPELLGSLISVGIAYVFLKRHRKFFVSVPCAFLIASLAFAICPLVSSNDGDCDEPKSFFMGPCGLVIRERGDE
jgi:hypothetical protein